MVSHWRDLKVDYETLANNLETLRQKSGYDIIQSNGQRVYAPPTSSNIPTPPRGCEIFLGRLPRFMFENELVPLVESVGKIYKFRLMLDFNGVSRGFAFAEYFTPEKADLAVKRLHGYKLRNGTRIAVYKSLDNCTLFVGNLPRYVTKEQVQRKLEEYASGIVEVIMYDDQNNRSANRGYVFVKFENHTSAAIARRQLAPADLELFEPGTKIHVDWSEPIPEMDPLELAQVTKLYLSNLPIELETWALLKTLETIVGYHNISRIYKKNNYAFVHFRSREQAEVGFRRLSVGWLINDRKIDIAWARPPKYSKLNRLNAEPTNRCKSVPPKIRRRIQSINSRNSSPVSPNTVSTPSDSSEGHTPDRNEHVTNRPSQNWPFFVPAQSSMPFYSTTLPNQALIPSQGMQPQMVQSFENFQGHVPIQYGQYGVQGYGNINHQSTVYQMPPTPMEYAEYSLFPASRGGLTNGPIG